MSQEIDTEQILQAISELSEEIKGVSHKIDNVDAKLSVLSDGLLHTQEEVKRLKNA